MSKVQSCPGIINSSNQNSDIAPLRVAILNGCFFTQVDYFNMIIKALKIPFVITYTDSYGEKVNGTWTGIMGELVYNRSDFSANIASVNDRYYNHIQYSPTFTFANAITILSGKILANSESGFSILESFSLKLWLLLCAILIVVAICHRILHKENSSWIWYILDMFGHFSKLWFVFINQSNQFTNICCVKHLILNSVTVVSIFVFTLFFGSEILSNLLNRPLLKIDTLDELNEYINQNEDVKLITDKISTTWETLQMSDDERFKFIVRKMTDVPLTKFDYTQVYHGKSIIISFDVTFERMLKSNRGLSFHMSADRLYGYQFGFLYSKYIDSKIKIFIDSMMTSLFESGIRNYMEERKGRKWLNIEEDDRPQKIYFSYFKKVILIYLYGEISLIFSLIFEILFKFCYYQFIQTVPQKTLRHQ